MVVYNRIMENKVTFHLSKFWRRVIALVCVVAMLVSMFSYLASVSISPEDGIGADTLARHDDFVNADAAERAQTAAASLFSRNQDFSTNYQKASVHIGKAEYEKALACIENCIELLKGTTVSTELSDDVWLKYGCLQAVLGQYDKALDGFAHMSAKSEYRSESELISAQIALERTDMPGAYTHLTAYLECAPQDATVYGLYANVCYYTQRIEQAQQWYEKAETAGIVLDGSEYLLWGMCLMDTGDYAGAQEKLSTALDSGYGDKGLCLSQLAVCSYLQGNYTDVLEKGAQALEAGSETVDEGMLRFYMGMSAFSAEDYDTAISCFDAAQEKQCAEQGLWFYRGFSKMLKDDNVGAITDFTVCVDAQADLTDSALLYRGICYLQSGDTKKAREDLTLAVNSQDETVAKSAQNLLWQIP